MLITLAIFVPGLMFMPCLDSDPRLYVHKFWMTALVSVALPDVLIGTLFLKKVNHKTLKCFFMTKFHKKSFTAKLEGLFYTCMVISASVNNIHD